MSIIYRPTTHDCYPPMNIRRQPRGTIWRCDECGEHLVTDGNDRWARPFWFSAAGRRIKRMEATP